MTERTAGADARQLVKFPEPMRVHTITSMQTPPRHTSDRWMT